MLALTVLPAALREKSFDYLSRFESGYERIGIPSLLVQVVTGVWLAHNMVPDVGDWFSFDDRISRLIFIKLALLLLTVLFAIHARFRIIPNLTEENLRPLAYHIIPVTILAVMFVVIGSSFRTGLIL